MRILLVGVSCVGKSIMGKLLADKWGYTFVDFDLLVEEKMGTSIERIQETCLTNDGYREKVKHLLAEALNEYRDNLVIAMPPSGLYSNYKSIIDRYHSDVITVALKDRAKNILERLVFYDRDSNILKDYVVNDSNREYYYNEIKEDIAYFYSTHKKANIKFNINGMNAKDAVEALAVCIEDYVASK